MMLRFCYMEGNNWQEHIVSARNKGQNIVSSGVTLNERGDGTVLFIDIDEGPTERNGVKVGESGEFKIHPNVACPVCGAYMGEYWETLGDNKEIECEECGTVFSVEIEHTWYYTVKLFNEVPQ